MRYAMAKVAAKTLSGKENNTRKWKCVKSLRQIFNALPFPGVVFYSILHFDIFFLLNLRTPEEADMRYAMAKVAAKILSGEENNTRKWKCIEDLAPNEEGAPKTLCQHVLLYLAENFGSSYLFWHQILNELPFPGVIFLAAQNFGGNSSRQ